MTGNSGSALTIDNAICNDVLCYLSTARDSLPRDIIILNACAFYKSEKILQAKEIIHNICLEKIVNRKKTVNQPNPTTIDLQDILNLLERNENANLPRFLAENYNSLPPNGFESMAAIISSLRDEMFALKSEIVQLRENNLRDQRSFEDVESIKQDVNDIKLSINSLRRQKPVTVPNDVAQITVDDITHPVTEMNLQRDTAVHTTCRPDSKNDDIPDVSLNPNPQPLDYSGALRSNRRPSLNGETGSVQGLRVEHRDNKRANGSLHQGTRVSGGISQFHKRRRVIGTSNGNGALKAATQNMRQLDIFIGGCSLESSIDDIKNHCSNKGIVVRNICDLETRALWYKAFKLTVNADDREKLLVPEAWPEGVFVRKFFNARGTNDNVA